MRAFPLLDRFKAGLLPGVVCALLIWGLVSVGWMRNVERLTLDALFRVRGPRDADPRIVVIAVDDAAVVRAGERTGSGWPLPRRYYARAVKELKALGARTVAFDVLFSEPGPNADEDAELALQCRLAKNVTQACAFQIAEKRTELPLDIDARSLPPRFSLGDSPLVEPRNVVWASAPLPDLSSGAVALGHLNVFPEVSGTLRRVPHVLRWRGRIYPSLALAATSHYLGMKPVVRADESEVVLGQRSIPLDNESLSFINWIGAGGSYPTFGLNQLLDGTVPADAIRGRLVIIGITAMGAFENRATPFSGGVPAVDFQANAMDDILSNRILRAAPAGYEWLLVFLFPILCSVITVRRAGTGFWPVPVLMLLLAATGAVLLMHDIYLPIGAPLVGGALAFAVTAAGGYRREWESSARSDASMSSLVRGTTLLSAALGASGRDQERLLSIIRATARETLNANEVYLLVDEGGEHDDPLMVLAARRATQAKAGWVWPPPSSDHLTPRRGLSRRKPPLLPEYGVSEESHSLLQGKTLVAAPLPSSRPHVDAAGEAAPPRPLLEREFCGALVAVGRRDGHPFSARDALLLEALAEGAALALENWRYSEALRGRIESANRELSGAYQLLAEQSAKLFAAVESIDAALVVCDAQGLAAFVNPAGARVLRGATPILGERVASALAAGDLEELAALFENLRSQGADAEPVHLETVRGREILSAQFTPLVHEDGQLLGAMIVVSDVTAQRELDRMKTDFVGYVAHELRTPLTTILGYASLLDQSAALFSEVEIKEMSGVISRHCRRMNRMISDLLDISRLEAGVPLPIFRVLFDLVPLCQRLLEEQKPYLNPTPHFDLVLDHPPYPVEFMGDHDRMEQVVINLLSNAIKYSPEGGTVTLRLRRDGANIILEVSDEGIGLTRDQINNLFQKFYRTNDARARGIKGTGLGLNLVRQIIEAHGGDIEVNSKRDEGGRGSTFRVTLPAGLPFS